jgi:hypothetical protein
VRESASSLRTAEVPVFSPRLRLLFALFALLLLFTSWARHVDTPFTRVLGFADWIGNENGRIAWNHVRYGFAETRGAQIRNLEPAEPADRIYYHGHPATLDVLTGLVFAALGHKEIWAHRLVPLFAHLLALLLLVRLARALGSDPPLVLGVYALLPMTSVHGLNLSYEPLCLAAILGLVLLHHRGWRYRLAPLFVLLGLLDFPVLYLGPWFALLAFLQRERNWLWRVGLTAALGVACVASIGLHVLHLLWSMGGLQAGHGPSWSEYILNVFRKTASVLPELGDFVSGQLRWLQLGYTAPLLALTLVGAVFLVRDPRRRAAVFGLAFVALLHFAVFPAHASVHDFWWVYLAPFVAFAVPAALDRLPAPLTPFVLSMALLLSALHSERIWQERAAPPARAMGQDLAARFSPEEVLLAFRTPPGWALETFRGHPTHDAEQIFLPGQEAQAWSTLIDQLGAFAQLERPMLGVMPVAAAEYAGLLDAAFPGARQSSRGDWLVWDLRPFVLEPGRSPYFSSRMGEARAAGLAQRVLELRCAIVAPPGARVHLLAERASEPTWFRSRLLSAGPYELLSPEQRSRAWLVAPGRSEGAERILSIRQARGQDPSEIRELSPQLRVRVLPPATR